MALSGRLQIRESIEGSGDLSSNDHLLHTIDVNGQLALPTAGDIAFVLVNAADVTAQGEEGTVTLVGKEKVVAGESIAAGDRIAANGSGQAVTAATSGDAVVGIALEDAASGELFKMLVTVGGGEVA